MNRLPIALTVMSVAAFTHTASAADLPRKAPAPRAPVLSWTGCYIGGNVGYGWLRSTDQITGAESFVNNPLTSDPVRYARNAALYGGEAVCVAHREPAPLADVPVTINSAAFTEPLVLMTDENGYYYKWLDQSASPLTVGVNAGSGYATGSATGVILYGGQTTIQDFTLRLLQPCLTAAPSSILATIPLGTSTTKPLKLWNLGGADATFAFENTATGYTAPASTPLGGPTNTVTIGDLSFSANPHPPTKSTDPNAGYARKVAAGSTMSA